MKRYNCLRRSCRIQVLIFPVIYIFSAPTVILQTSIFIYFIELLPLVLIEKRQHSFYDPCLKNLLKRIKKEKTHLKNIDTPWHLPTAEVNFEFLYLKCLQTILFIFYIKYACKAFCANFVGRPLWSNGLMAKELFFNPGVSCSKPLGGSKDDSAFHASEVNKMSTRHFWELSVKK